MHHLARSFCLLVFIASALAKADYVSRELRISHQSLARVNGEVSVNPGEIIDLSADLWQSGPGCLYSGCPQNIPPGEVLWYSDDRPGSVCDLYSSVQCHQETEFRVTSNGVLFQVPNYFNVPITLTASLRGGEPSARLVLMPRPTYVSSPPPVQTVVVRERSYPLVVFRPPVVLPPRIYYPPPRPVYYPRPYYPPPHHHVGYPPPRPPMHHHGGHH